MTTLDGVVQKFAEHYRAVNGFWPTWMVNGALTGRPPIQRLSPKTFNRNRLQRLYSRAEPRGYESSPKDAVIEIDWSGPTVWPDVQSYETRGGCLADAGSDTGSARSRESAAVDTDA